MIRLQFSLQPAISSQLIAWFSAGHFSHVDCIVPNGLLLGARSDVIGGIPAGVQYRPQYYAHWVRRTVFEIPATQTEERAFYRFLTSQIGKPYDHQAIFAFVLNRDWREDDSWICSELQAAALEASGITPPLYLAANKITPVALALAVSALSGTRVKDTQDFQG